MSKIKLLSLVLVFLAILALVTVVAINFLKNKNQNNPDNSRQSNLSAPQEPTKAVISTEVYQDSSGFSFKYPKEVTVSDITPNDNTYYSKLSLKKDSSQLTFSVYDSQDNPYKSDTLIGATTLDTIAINQYEINGKLISAGLDKQILYVIEGPKDGGYWEDIQNNLISSFQLGLSRQQPQTAADTNTTYETEEVIN
ncbi:hypothetical protein HYS03_02590 [Candidatus Woesebacteria bacterium]|nr:hypothetical protein [Candidatus Woesebacteria bacterium]QQG47915.1 MAG: hypothetical protein HY044_02410 [Candidatus Woesebacteria bacterium]